MRILFVYLGRRGAIPRFALDLMRAIPTVEGIQAQILLSSSNELADQFANFPEGIVRFAQTFKTAPGSLLTPFRLPRVRRQLHELMDGANLVVELMPHIWSPFIMPERRSVEWWTIIHDARPHPGDMTGLAHRLLTRSCRRSDRVITLSEAVAADILSQKLAAPEHLIKLFHPDLTFDAARPPPNRSSGPLRFLFFGRILPYKGLDLFVDAIRIAKGRGADIEALVCGDGALNVPMEKMRDLGVELRNHWIADRDIAEILASCDVMVASHKEASQSGIVAAAFGAGMPVITTPVGGLREQVTHGETGRIASAVSADAIAAEIIHLSENRGEIDQLKMNISQRRGGRSMYNFLATLLALAKQHRGG